MQQRGAALGQGPGDVFLHQLAGRAQAVHQGLRQGRVARLAPPIAQGHGQVAAPACPAHAPHGTAFGALQEVGFGPGPQLQQAATAQAVAFIKVRQRGALGVLVPGAGQLAVVTAVDAVAHERAQVGVDRAGLFNGQVADAAPRVQPVRRHDGLRGAHRHAGRATAAMGAGGLAQRQRQVDEDLAQEEHGTGLARQRQRVLATPGQAGARGQFHLQDRGRVGEHAVAPRAHLGRQLVGQALQALAHHLVIVPSPGIQRYHGALRVLQGGFFLRHPGGVALQRQVVHARADHAHRAGHQFGRPRALQAVHGHVGHAAVKARIQPGAQARFGAGQVDAADADL